MTVGVATGWAVWVRTPVRQGHLPFELHVLSVGDGACAVLAAPGGRAFVFDAGTNTNSDVGEVLSRALQVMGIDAIEAVVVSHGNFDHFSGLPTLFERYPAAQWLVSSHFAGHPNASASVGTLYRRLADGRRPTGQVHIGQDIALAAVRVEVLWPPEGLDEPWKENDCSLVVRVSGVGLTVLFTGDVERDALRALLARERAGETDMRADVLIAPHHGQVIPEVTADFLGAVSPRVVVASTRAPRPKLRQVAAEVLGPGCRVIETGLAGAVRVSVGAGGALEVELPYCGASRP